VGTSDLGQSPRFQLGPGFGWGLCFGAPCRKRKFTMINLVSNAYGFVVQGREIDCPCSAKGVFGFFTSSNTITAARIACNTRLSATVCEYYVFDWLQRGNQIQIFIYPFSSFPPLNAIKKIAHTPAARARSTTKVCILNISPHSAPPYDTTLYRITP
jgi:hypothetical protein